MAEIVARHPKTLGLTDAYQYAGTCKHCGFHDTWAVKKTSMSYQRFRINTLDKRPTFTAFCYGCCNLAVFDLTALSSEES